MNKLYLAIKILSVIGISLAVYLLIEQVIQDPNAPCNITRTVNCDAIISGPVAKTLGIPTPLYGLIGYIVILFSAVKRNSKLLLGMTTFGLLFCLRIAYIELFELYTICPVCIKCQVIMLSVFIMAIILNKDLFKTKIKD
jgi:uncharacterized membrane protein